MSLDGFDPVVHVPVRLRLCCLLAGVERMAFPTLREHLGVSASVLSKQARALVEDGVVEMVKEPQDASGARAWLALTGEGRTRLAGHLAALEAIAATAREAAQGQPG